MSDDEAKAAAVAALSERFGRAVAVDADPCGFCGKHSREVKRMVASETGALICEECVYLAAKHLVADGWTPPGLEVRFKIPDHVLAWDGDTLGLPEAALVTAFDSWRGISMDRPFLDTVSFRQRFVGAVRREFRALIDATRERGEPDRYEVVTDCDVLENVVMFNAMLRFAGFPAAFSNSPVKVEIDPLEQPPQQSVEFEIGLALGEPSR